MWEIVRLAAGYLIILFVVSSMLSIGLTQKASRIVSHLRNHSFLITMLLVNLIVVPAVMIFALRLVSVAPHYETGLILFGLAAGAPFLIHLAKTSQRDLSLATTVLMVLMVGSVVTMPILLPRLIAGVSVSAWEIVHPMLLQIVLPLVIGLLILQFFESFAAVIQPWVGKISNIALYASIIAIFVGYSSAFSDPDLWVGLAVGLVVLVLAFFIGYMIGDGHDHLKDVGGLGTAQRGTASAMIVASSAFDDPRVLLIITMLNTLAVVLLILAAKWLSPDNRFSFLTHVAADSPKSRATSDA
jgi:BASS family bile acid:Na+ symporter